MSNQKKTPIGVFHILKSVMDAKHQAAISHIELAKRASAEYPILCEHITALNQYIRNCRAFDPREQREAELDLADKEYQLLGIQSKIFRGQNAKQELVHTEKFYNIYQDVIKQHKSAPKIRELREQANIIEAQMDSLDDKIWACETDMDSSCRSLSYVEQARSDAITLKAQYDELASNLACIKVQIKQLQK